jgi:type VI secretion system secreted protein Hcp
MKKHLFLFLLSVSFLLSSNAQRVYIKIEGSKSGVIKDKTSSSKLPDRMDLTSYSFETGTLMRDMTGGTGAATGRKSHGPVIITKNIGQSSPMLLKVLTTNEILKSVVIEVFRINNSGMEVLEQTITLTNASITNFKQSFSTESANSKTLQDEVRFIYQKMTVVYADGGVMVEDNWNNN